VTSTASRMPLTSKIFIGRRLTPGTGRPGVWGKGCVDPNTNRYAAGDRNVPR
jgi:hypothetical protein